MDAISGKEPLLQKLYLNMFYDLKQDYNINNSIKNLDFNPKPSRKALEDAFIYLKEDWQK